MSYTVSSKRIKNTYIRQWLIGIVTAVTGLVVYNLHQIDHLTNDRLFNFPVEFSGWKGKSVIMENWVHDSLGTEYAIMRNYVSEKGASVNLSIVWYDDRYIGFHSPEKCLGGYGNKVKSSENIYIDMPMLGKVKIGKILSATDDNKRYLVYYYYIKDGFITDSQTLMRTRIVWDRIRLKRSSAAFVRIMTRTNFDTVAANSLLIDFLKKSFSLVVYYTGTRI